MSSSNLLPDGYALGSWWYYAPNKGAPIAFAVIFCGSGVWHLVQCQRMHSWKSTGFLPWAASLFVAGFVLREIGAFTYTNLNIYISSSVMLLCAPPIYEAANFFTLGRILYYVPYHAPMRPGLVVTTFAGLQVIIEAINAQGGSRVANSALGPAQQDIGKALLKTALILQLACMVAFVVLAGTFEHRCRKAGIFPKNLKTVLRVLYFSCLLITIRTVYRTVEYFEDASLNYNDPSAFPTIFKHEWFFWVFEASLMGINTWLLNIMHPSRFLPRNLKIYLAPDGHTEIEGRGFEDNRFWLWTILDMLNIAGMIRRRNGGGAAEGRGRAWRVQMREEAEAQIAADGGQGAEMRPLNAQGKERGAAAVV